MIAVQIKWIMQKIHASCLNEENVKRELESTVKRVSTDTRTLQKGDVFIALVGPNFNGHNYIETAITRGASCVIVSQKISSNIPILMVSDTRIALGLLGAAIKDKVSPKTIGITGSSGKTTVKEMVSSILGHCGKVLATKGNFNNDIGVPLTLLELEEHHDYAVIEMGANHQGEIEYTSKLVKPDVATIVNASPAHIEGFGSLFGVARAKSEMVKGLDNKSIAILNADSQFYDYWQSNTNTNQVLTFSYDTTNGDFHAKNVFVNAEGCAEFELVTPIGNAPIRLRVPGLHNVGNAVLSAALAMSAGASLVNVRQGLFAMKSVTGRLTVKVASDKVKVIDDTYNANVGSVKAAIDLLATFKGFRVFVFGDMGELGDQAAMYHNQIGEYAVSKNIDALISCGPLSAHASAAMQEKGMACGNKTDAYQALMRLIGPILSSHFPNNTHPTQSVMALFEKQNNANSQTDLPQPTMHLENSPTFNKQSSIPVTILVKGSRSAKMETLVESVLSFDFSQPEDDVEDSHQNQFVSGNMTPSNSEMIDKEQK